MPKYVLAYHGGRHPATPEEGNKMMNDWKAWMASLGDAVVDPGMPVGPSKTVSKSGVTDDGGSNPLSGITIVQAETIDSAIKMASACPHLDFDGSIEVAEALDLPMD